ncbi:MAG: hypothetical protein Q4D98_05465 [Planctomycetia bacterium]|nr:hypothetical protein [Planctomycetia bacterium]
MNVALFLLFSLTTQGAWLGPVDMVLSPDGSRAYVALFDASEIRVLETEQDSTLATIPLPAGPTGMALSPDGKTLYVTCDPAEASLLKTRPAPTVKNPVLAMVETTTGSVRETVEIGEGARSPVGSPDGKYLYWCARFDTCLEVFSISEKRVTRRIPMVREPFAAAVSLDGKTVVVSNLLPLERTDEQYLVMARVALVDTTTWETVWVPLPNGGINVRGVCVSPDGEYAYVVHGMASYMLTTGQVKGGWMNMNSISFIDLRTKKIRGTLSLDHYGFAAANPWGVAVSDDGKMLVVTHSGTADISVIDRLAMHRNFETGLFPYPAVGPTPDHAEEIVPAQIRVPLSGEGPRAVVIRGDTAFVVNYFSDTIDRIHLDENSFNSMRSMALGERPIPTFARLGEQYFHDGRLCYEQWQSCASCHLDARVDGLNWDLLNDGVGNPKNTKSMVLAHRTPPSMATGVRADAETAVRKGIQMILQTEPVESQAAAMDAYLKSLEPRRAPILRDERQRESRVRGRHLFYRPDLACDTCHSGENYTDENLHDVGTETSLEWRKFDTPTLRECWRTAPYLHDGRYTTLFELFRVGKHGGTEKLSDSEIRDLEAFLRSL